MAKSTEKLSAKMQEVQIVDDSPDEALPGLDKMLVKFLQQRDIMDSGKSYTFQQRASLRACRRKSTSTWKIITSTLE